MPPAPVLPSGYATDCIRERCQEHEYKLFNQHHFTVLPRINKAIIGCKTTSMQLSDLYSRLYRDTLVFSFDLRVPTSWYNIFVLFFLSRLLSGTTRNLPIDAYSLPAQQTHTLIFLSFVFSFVCLYRLDYYIWFQSINQSALVAVPELLQGGYSDCM